MKTLLIALFSITCLSAQEFIGKDWDIDNFLGEFPDVTDVYFLKKPRQKNPCVADNTILFRPDGTFFPPCMIDKDHYDGQYQIVGENYLKVAIGSYYIHKVSNDEFYFIKSTGNLITDKQKAKNAEALARFMKIYSRNGKSPNPSFQLKSDVPKDERIGKLVRKLFHLISYEILKGYPTDDSTLYLVKDLKTNIYYYLREEYYKDKVTVYYFTEKDLKQRAKEQKRQQ